MRICDLAEFKVLNLAKKPLKPENLHIVSLLSEIKGNVWLKGLARCFVVDDLLLLHQSLVLPSLAVRHVLVKHHFFLPFGFSVRTESCLLASSSQLIELGLLAPLQCLPQRWCKELPKVSFRHSVHPLLPLWVLEIRLRRLRPILIFYLDIDWPPESVDGNDVLF